MIKRIIDHFRRQKQPKRIDDLDRAVDALIETAQYIVPEKRFKAIKIFVGICVIALCAEDEAEEERTRLAQIRDDSFY